MSGDDDRAGAEYDQPRVPSVLRERVDELFVAERGYEPASFQEALSVVVDLAADSVDDASESASGPSSSVGTGPGPGKAATSDTAGTEEHDGADADAPDSGDDGTDLVDGDLSGASIGSDDASVSFDDYVEGLEESSDAPSPAVESILDTEHADGVVRELAAEVLDEMTRDAFQELEHGVDQGVGAGVTDGMGATDTAGGAGTAPSGSTGDGVPDSLTADPESDCAVCGRAHPVSVLQTTILEEDGSVALVCPSCAE